MNKEMKNIDKLIKKTYEEIAVFESGKQELLQRQTALEKDHDAAQQRLHDSLKDIAAQIMALEKKREEISAPIQKDISQIEIMQDGVRRLINNGESKANSLPKMKKVKEIIEKIDAGYRITIVDSWGDTTALGKFYKNNYRPDGWTIVDIIIKGTSVYCQSSIAKSPRKLFDLLKKYRWTITLSKGLKPIHTDGGRVILCPKCGQRDAIQTKACPVCITDEEKHPIEYTCRKCGHVIDKRADDRHTFSDDPETIVIRGE